jgi:hypothetical protein
MIYSPSIMENFPLKTIKVVGYSYKKGNTKTVLHFNGRLTHFMSLLQQAQGENDSLCMYGKTNSATWCRLLHGETTESLIRDTVCKTATQDFEKAEAALKTPLTRGRQEPSVIGAAFNIGRIMQGHPVSCYRRPKKKLPPKDLHFSISVSSLANAELIMQSMVKIVRAAHEYTLNGGAVKLTCHYGASFSKPNPETGAEGIMISLEIPIANGALAAFSASIQFFRAVVIPIAQCFSGLRHDSLVVMAWDKAGMQTISGQGGDATATLEALKIS